MGDFSKFVFKELPVGIVKEFASIPFAGRKKKKKGSGSIHIHYHFYRDKGKRENSKR